jgi:hypothetical protein
MNLTRWRGLVGKAIGRRIYVHRSAAHLIVDPHHLAYAEHQAGEAAAAWNGLRVDRDTQALCFQVIDGFDTRPEPWVGRCTTVAPDGTVSITTPTTDPWVHHHKWLWVLPGYTGCDLAAAYARSLRIWANLEPGEAARLGRRSTWESWLARHPGVDDLECAA